MRTLILATAALAALITASTSTATLSASVYAGYPVAACDATPDNMQPITLAGVQRAVYGSGDMPSA